MPKHTLHFNLVWQCRATITGTAGNDVLTDTDYADTIYGLNGDDTINGGIGADLIYGDAGTDTVKFSGVQVTSPAPIAIGLLDGGDGFDTLDPRSISPVIVGKIQNTASRTTLHSASTSLRESINSRADFS